MITIDAAIGLRQTREGQRQHALDSRAIFHISTRLFILGWLVATSANVAAADPVFATDISFWSGNISATEISCWRGRGVQHVVTGTQNRDIARQQLQTAVNGGMTVDAYVLLYWNFDIAQQVQNALSIIEGFPVKRLWIDAEQARGNWSSSQLVQKIQEGVNACGNMPCGIYTRKVWWRDNVGNTSAFSHLPIWYAYYDGQHGFNDWYSPSAWYEGPFGGWSNPTGKQYDSDWTAPDLCGVNVDYNIMYVLDDDPPGLPSLPPAPTGLTPDGATIASGSVTLSANAIANATGYEFKIEYWDGAWQRYFTYSPNGSAQTFWPVFDDAQYRWQVRAQNQAGWGEWSAWATFNFGNVGGPPPAPTQLSPDNAAIPSGSVTLSADAIADATRYEFEISYWDGATWQYYYTYASTNNAQTFWPAYHTEYQWRVRAENQFGWGAWSTSATFGFGNLPPPAPTGLTPDGATIASGSVTLSANAITNTTGYEFEIGYWDGGAWRYYYTYAPANNTQTFWPAYANRQYRWRVRAENVNGWGKWSTWATFNFGNVPVERGSSVPWIDVRTPLLANTETLPAWCTPNHWTPWNGNWASDLWKDNGSAGIGAHPNPTCGEDVYLRVSPSTLPGAAVADSLRAKVINLSSYPFACASRKYSDGGYQQAFEIYATYDGVEVAIGWVLFAHIDNMTFNFGDWIDDPTEVKIGTVFQGNTFGGCWGSCHVHIEFKNYSGQSCYENICQNPYDGLSSGSVIGKLGGDLVSTQRCP